MGSPKWPREAEQKLWAQICKESFWHFFLYAWGATRYMEEHPQDRWVTERVHKPLADWLQSRAEEWRDRRSKGIKERTKIAVVIPRSFGKTVMITKAFSLWCHLWDRDLAVAIGSEVSSKAKAFLEPIKEVMAGRDKISHFVWLYGNWYDPDRTWTQADVVHAYRRNTGRTEPSFTTWGVDSGLTGYHPDLGILDDPLSEEKIKESGLWIKAVNQSIASLRPAFRSDSFFAIVATRYRDNDPIGTYLLREGIRSWTGMPSPDDRLQVRESGEWDVYFLQARDQAGESILPEVHPTTELDKYEKSMPAEFAAQMMNNPGSGEHMKIKPEDIETMWTKLEEVPRQIVVSIHLDTAFKEINFTGTGAESVICAVGHDPRGNGDVYHLENFGSPSVGDKEFMGKLVEIVRKYQREGKRISGITDEEEAGGGKRGVWKTAIESALIGAGITRVPPIYILPRHKGTSKDTRITSTFSYWLDGHVKLVENSPGVYDLVEQVLRFGVVALKDRIDAFSDCFAEEIYRRILIPEGDAEEGMRPRSPGDEVLKVEYPRTRAQITQLYDWQHGEYVDNWDPERDI